MRGFYQKGQNIVEANDYLGGHHLFHLWQVSYSEADVSSVNCSGPLFIHIDATMAFSLEVN